MFLIYKLYYYNKNNYKIQKIIYKYNYNIIKRNKYVLFEILPIKIIYNLNLSNNI